MEKVIQIRGARTNNLKNIDIDIPLNKIVCISGPSGSGKSSLAFHTLFTEAKRRFVNSLPTSVKFFWDIPHEVDVDSIYPVLPVWGLPQYNPVVGNRAVVSELMELDGLISDLFFYEGVLKCPDHDEELKLSSINEQISKAIKKFSEKIHMFIPKDFFPEGQFPVRVFEEEGKTVNDYSDPRSEAGNWWELLRFKKGNVLKVEKTLKEQFPTGLEKVPLLFFDAVSGDFKTTFLKFNYECSQCDFSLSSMPTSPRQLSTQSPVAACKTCNGHGMLLEFDEKKIVKNQGDSIKDGAITLLNYARFKTQYDKFIEFCKKSKIPISAPYESLSEEAKEKIWNGEKSFKGIQGLLSYLQKKKYKQHVRIFIRTLQSEVLCPDCEGSKLTRDYQGYDFNGLALKDALTYTADELFNAINSEIKKDTYLYKKINFTLQVARDLGLGHLKLNRKVKSLSPNEYQRLLLVKYLNFKGSGSLFILDEPALGLTDKIQSKIYKGLNTLKEQGNTVLIVEHSEYLKSKSDIVIEMGPGAGSKGGEVLSIGPYNTKSLQELKFEKLPKPSKEFFLHVLNCSNYGHTLRDIKIPLNQLTVFTGESGTGKTSLILKTIANGLHKKVVGSHYYEDHGEVIFKKNVDFGGVQIFDSSPGRSTGRSTVGTITGLTPYVRKHYSRLQISQSLGLKEGHFSPNSELGMCPSCEGTGKKIIEMSFMEDMVFTCEDCQGMKVRKLYADIYDGNLTFGQAMNAPVHNVFSSVNKTPKVIKILELLETLKLSYLSLDRSLSSLSGGERQRIKLLAEVVKGVKNSILFFENLSFGLSSADMQNIVRLLQQLLALGNTIVVIDHNKHLIKVAHKCLELKRKSADQISISSQF